MYSSHITTCILAFLCISTGSYAATQVDQKKYVIMDNDWISLGFIPFLIAMDAGWEVLGLTSCTGNTWQHQVALHALATLSLGNLTSCIPVIPGSTFPLINTPARFQAWEAVHGKLPWEGAFAPYNAAAEASGSDPSSGDDPFRVVKSAFIEGLPSDTLIRNLKKGQSAASFMIEMVHKYPGQVSIYAGGSMTNIALAVRSDDQFASLAKELIVMGGYIDVNLLEVTGSINQANINSDFNLMIDPEAAKIAFTAKFPRIVFAGNVANQVISSQEFLDEIYEVKNPYSELVHDHYGSTLPFWDEIAAAIMVNSSIITNSTTFYVDVDTSYGSPSYGNIHAYQSALMPPGLRNVTYVNSIDANALHSIIKRAVQNPKTCCKVGNKFYLE